MIIVAKITCYDIRPRSVPSDITGFIFNGVSKPSSREQTGAAITFLASMIRGLL